MDYETKRFVITTTVITSSVIAGIVSFALIYELGRLVDYKMFQACVAAKYENCSSLLKR